MGKAAAWHHLYKTARWLRRRRAQLTAQPLCEWCGAKGRVAEANIAHHAVPHRGDPVAFHTGRWARRLADRPTSPIKQTVEAGASRQV